MGVPLYPIWCMSGSSAPKWHDADVCSMQSRKCAAVYFFCADNIFMGCLEAGTLLKNLLMVTENSQIVININLSGRQVLKNFCSQVVKGF
jgi:hypothetical protein